MENATEALKIAFGVLIFVLALSITISVFGEARLAIDRILDNAQKGETFVTDENGNYLNYVNFDINGGTRTVEADTVVSSMYRALKENFVIYFYGIENTSGCNLQYDENKETHEKIYYIDLSRYTIAAGKEIEFMDNILSANSNRFYKYLLNKKFTEKLGEYYQNDEQGESDIAEVNKTKKRVIIYMVQ